MYIFGFTVDHIYRVVIQNASFQSIDVSICDMKRKKIASTAAPIPDIRYRSQSLVQTLEESECKSRAAR